MAITPVGISATGVDVWHSERQHGGTVPWADIDFPKRLDGTPHQYFLILPCPVAGCDSASVHPVSGGVDRPAVQELMARFYMRRAAALGLDAATLVAARALVAKRADELEGRATNGAANGAAAVAGRGG